MRHLALSVLVYFVIMIEPAEGCPRGWYGHGGWAVSCGPVYAMPVYYPPPVVYMPVCQQWTYPAWPSHPPRVVESVPERRLPPAAKSTTLPTPYAEIKPAGMMEESRIPKAALPTAPATPTEPPKIEFTAPKPDAPKSETPKVELPKIEMPKVEANAPGVPKLELPPLAKPSMPNLELPPLTTPQLDKSQSKYLTRSRMEVVPVAGRGGEQFAIKFENHSSQAVTLHVHGQTMTLAARHAVTATVPASFRWRIGDDSEETVRVADDVSGYTIVIK